MVPPENGVAYLFDGATGALIQTFFDPFPIGPVVAGFNYFSWSVATERPATRPWG